MTITSLWNVLDESRCGTPVGIDSFPLTSNNKGREGTFGIDASIWICEALASSALSSFHSDPVLYLVYQRTVALLKHGFRLIFVLEGEKRVRNDGNEGEEIQMRKRRFGSKFFAATKRCEALLNLLGVPVVRAEAEGEALCALLNEKGIVDSVISNDSDCFVFGAQVVYTKFTLENLQNGTVMRYDANDLRAAVPGSNRSIALSKSDLIAFALLTGSDMTKGVTNIGHKKAITFMDACRAITHNPNKDTCLDKLLSWGQDRNEIAETCIEVNEDSSAKARTCSLCLHPGSKDEHKRNGCAQCGTSAGEGCFVVTSMEKIVMSMQQKIGRMQHFQPRVVVDAYLSPNSNAVPNTLASISSTYFITSPKTAQLFQTSLMLKGSTLSSSQDYIRQTLPPLLARLDLFSTAPRNVYATISNQKYKPIPIRIEKKIVKKSIPCYEIIWAIVIDQSDQQIHFSTLEFQALIDAEFTRIVETYDREERKKQRGMNEQERYRKFVGTQKPRLESQLQREKQFKRSMKPSQGKKRERHFNDHRFTKPRMMPEIPPTQSNDVTMLMGHMPETMRGDNDVDINEYDSTRFDSLTNCEDNPEKKRGEDSTTDTFPLGHHSREDDNLYSSDSNSNNERDAHDIPLQDSATNGIIDEKIDQHIAGENRMPALSPNQERIFCNLGMCVVECTPIRRKK